MARIYRLFPRCGSTQSRKRNQSLLLESSVLNTRFAPCPEPAVSKNGQENHWFKQKVEVIEQQGYCNPAVDWDCCTPPLTSMDVENTIFLSKIVFSGPICHFHVSGSQYIYISCGQNYLLIQYAICKSGSSPIGCEGFGHLKCDVMLVSCVKYRL